MTYVDGWEAVISYPTISFVDFVDVDEDVAVYVELTNANTVTEKLDKAEQDGDGASSDKELINQC